MQVYEHVRLAGVFKREISYLFGFYPVADTEEGVGEPTSKPTVLARAGRNTSYCPSEEFRRNARCLADQQVGCVNQPIQHPVVY